MATLNSVTTEIAIHLKKELDESFKRMLAQKVDNWRARLIRNSLEKKPGDAKFFFQDIWVPMERVSPIPDCVPAPVCPVMRSVKPIPAPLRYGTSLFDFVGSVDGSTSFDNAQIGMDLYLLAGKYSKNTIFYKYIMEHIEVEHPNLPYIRVRGIFDGPAKVMEFNCESNGQCDYWNMEYPCTKDVLQQVVQYIIAEFNPPNITDRQIEVNANKQEHVQDGR